MIRFLLLVLAAYLLVQYVTDTAAAFPGRWFTRLESSSLPASLAECEAAHPELGPVFATMSAQNRINEPYYKRICIYAHHQ